MKAGKSASFLEERGFAVGEFENLQGLFERSIEQLSTTLIEPVGRALRAQLALDLAQPCVASAKQVLDSLIGRPLDEGRRDAASADLARRLRAEFDQPGTLDEVDVEQEVRSCSREVAERVLARWFEKLNRALHDSASARLNMNLLPGTTSVEDMLAGIDFESHGIGRLVVVNGLRTYWDGLVQSALATKTPIELGRQLWIVPDASEAARPLVLFKNRDDALSCAQPKPATVPATPRAPVDREQRYVRLYNFVRSSLAPMCGSFQNELALGVFRASMASKLTNGLVSWDSPALHTALFGEARDPELDLMEHVERGVDLVVAGLAGGEPEARIALGSDRFGHQLAAYAGTRHLPVDAVEDAFAMAVCVGVEYQPMRNQMLGPTDTAFFTKFADFDPHLRFAQAHGVARDDAVRLMSTTFAGSALATPGVALLP